MTDGVSDPVIGWFSYRPGTKLNISLREAAVTRSLAAHVGVGGTGRGPSGVLFAVFSHNPPGASTSNILSLCHRFYHSGASPSAPLHAVPLQVLNLGRNLGSSAYEGISHRDAEGGSSSAGKGRMSLPPLVRSAGPSPARQAGSQEAPAYMQQLQSVAAATVQNQTKGIEQAYHGMLAELEALAENGVQVGRLKGKEAESHRHLLSQLQSQTST